MQIVHTISDLRCALTAHQRPAFVPTMGNLHEGHLALVRLAKPLGDVTVASIFVNRLQFLPHEDFNSYPRTWDSDCAKLKAAGCDLLFAPHEANFYPVPQTFKVQPPPELADILEGQFRPGFFVGVCTVVFKLFNCVQPAVAVFGKKDFQQQMVLRRMVEQFALPIDLVTGNTLRAGDGLALSSRNGYLSASERETAPQLARELNGLAERIRTLAAIHRENPQFQKSQDVTEKSEFATKLEALCADSMSALARSGWIPDYVSARRTDDLQIANSSADRLVIVAAARLGTTRLIDNLEV